MKIKLAKNELIHFVGIGGIGMSGLALIMNELGFKVQGSDISNNKNIERLRQKKIRVLIGHKKQNIKNTSILVISSAIKNNNKELMFAKKKKITNLHSWRNACTYCFFNEKYSNRRISWKNHNHFFNF